MSGRDNHAPLLLDVSRLVWRRWLGTRATGIDRICVAWTEHYSPRAQAVIVHRHGQAILPVRTSQSLFNLLSAPEHRQGARARFRGALAALSITRGAHLRDRLDGRGRFLLNPGHSGLQFPNLPAWFKRRNVRPVHLVHDLIPITHPQFCREGEDKRHRQRILTALDTACGVIANSAHTLETLGEFAAAENRAMPPAVVAWPGTPVLKRGTGMATDGPFFVILGTIEGRKNHAMLLSIWRRMISERGMASVPRLVIVGRRGWQADHVFEELDATPFGDRVWEAGPLDDRRLAETLSGARALLFPSFAEGYGIPLVEALALGVPVIASDLPVFREIGAGVCELLPPDDADAWMHAILEYSAQGSLHRARQIAQMESFRAPDWPTHFAKIDDFLDSLC